MLPELNVNHAVFAVAAVVVLCLLEEVKLPYVKGPVAEKVVHVVVLYLAFCLLKRVNAVECFEEEYGDEEDEE